MIMRFEVETPQRSGQVKERETRRLEPSEPAGTADKLRWHRQRMGLTQREAADKTGVGRRQYIKYEDGSAASLPKEVADRLAALFGIPAEELLDEYDRFLYKGQGKLVREYRESLGLGKKPFARKLKIRPETLRAWENDATVMQRRSWEKYFRDTI